MRVDMFKKILLSVFLCCVGVMPAYAQRTEMQCDIVTSNGSVVGGIYRHMQNGSYDIMIASGNTVPTDGTANYAKGCIFIDRDVATGIGGVYTNTGTADSCKFRLVDSKVLNTNSPTAIATTGSTPIYTIVPVSCTLTNAYFASANGYGSNTTNYATWQITNLGQDGLGTATLLHGSSTTKPPANGGLGTLGTNTTKTLTLTATSANLVLTKGDRLKLDVAVTGTLTNTLSYPSWQLCYGGTP